MDWGFYFFDKFVLLLVLIIATKLAIRYLRNFIFEMAKSRDKLMPKMSIKDAIGMMIYENRKDIGQGILELAGIKKRKK